MVVVFTIRVLLFVRACCYSHNGIHNLCHLRCESFAPPADTGLAAAFEDVIHVFHGLLYSILLTMDTRSFKDSLTLFLSLSMYLALLRSRGPWGASPPPPWMGYHYLTSAAFYDGPKGSMGWSLSPALARSHKGTYHPLRCISLHQPRFRQGSVGCYSHPPW